MKVDHDRLVLRRGRLGKHRQDSRSYWRPQALRRRWGRDIEDWPERESMRIGRPRVQTDDLRPIIRLLARNVGRPWNDVYSELCRTLDRRSLAGWHLLDHVDKDLVDRTGKRESYRAGFFVDDHGLLQQQEQLGRPQREDKPQDPDYQQIDGHHYLRVNGCWYELTCRTLLPGQPLEKRWYASAVMQRRLSSGDLRGLPGFVVGWPARDSEMESDEGSHYRGKLRTLRSGEADSIGLAS